MVELFVSAGVIKQQYSKLAEDIKLVRISSRVIAVRLILDNVSAIFNFYGAKCRKPQPHELRSVYSSGFSSNH